MVTSSHNKGASLRVADLQVTFGALVALNGVSWEVKPGEILGIIGPNGAGKSTCYNAVTNMVRRSGQVFINDEDVTTVPASSLASLGLRRAFQQNAFFKNITVLENMTAVLQDDYGTGLAGAIFRPFEERRKSRDAKTIAAKALERMGIPAKFHDLKPTEIPYGTQRMLSIALANGPGARILMLDEPAAGLGGEDMQHLLELLISLREEGMALIVIEHHMDLIMNVSDRVAVLDQGQMICFGTPAEVRKDPAVLEAYLGRDA